MASSLVLTGGVSIAKTLKESIVLPAHGFAVGDVLRWNNGTPSYVRAVADSAVNAEVLGIVSANTDVNTFELTYAGYVDLPQYAGLSYPILFLSGVCAGGLTHNPPSAVGTVIKPVVSRHPTSQGFVMHNYLGTQIGGSSTIAVDEIQPVGTIMPFAGTMVPETWLRCDGASYGIGSYAELYSNLLYSSGDRTPIYGYVATLTGTNLNNFSAGDVLQFKNNTNAWSGGLYDSNAEMIGVILSVTSTTAVVQTLPVYNSSDKTLSVPSIIFKAGSGTSTSTGNSQYRVLNSAGVIRGSTPVATVTGIAITHFNTPDLRGRVALGVNQTTLADLEGDATNLSAISGIYPLGSEGGEEKHTLTEGELPSHSHGVEAKDFDGGSPSSTSGNTNPNTGPSDRPYGSGSSAADFNRIVRRTKVGETRTAAGADADTSALQLDVLASAVLVIGNTGGSSSHNNMPPYVALQYIIKAKPYTRAAIIDGVDVPYNNLLIRSTDSDTLKTELMSGFSGGDLVFYTNSGEASKRGTERMRIEVGGEVGIGTNAPSQKLHVYDGALRVDLLSGTNSAILAGPGSNLQIKHTSGNSNLTMYNSSGGGFIFSTFQSGTEGERIRITGDGRLGIGKNNPSVALDVVGEVRSSTATTSSSDGSTLVTKSYIDTLNTTYNNKFSTRYVFLNAGGHQPGVPANTWFKLSDYGVPVGSRIIRVLLGIHTGQGPDYAYGYSRRTNGNILCDRRVLVGAAALASGDNAGTFGIGEIPIAGYFGFNEDTEIYLLGNSFWFGIDGYWTG